MRITLKVVVVAAAAVVTAGVIAASCGGSSGGSTPSPSVEFPGDLVIASPYAATGAAAMVVSKGPAAPAPEASYADKKAALEAMLAPTSIASCAFTLGIFGSASASPNCYGPQVNYEQHPNCPDTSGRPDICEAPNNSGKLPVNDLGIWNETEPASGNACAAEKITQLTGNVALNVDSAINILASMFCTMTVKGLGPLLPSGSIDLLAAMTDMLATTGVTGIALTEATLARQADDSLGNPVYLYTLKATATSPDGTKATGITLYLKHIPLDATGSTYHGKLSYEYAHTLGAPGSNVCNTLGVMTNADAGSILYAKSSATGMTYRLQSALFCDASAAHLNTTTYDIDPADKASGANPDGWGNDFNYFLTTFDPATGAGAYSYAWQAGTMDMNTRVFNATLASSAANTMAGCAYYGYGADAAAPGTLGVIDGFICNWAGPQQAGSGSDHDKQLAAFPDVQRQCMTLNATTKLYESDPAQIRMTYAPTNTCDYAGGTFKYSSDLTLATAPATNDRIAGAAVVNNLLPMTDMSFTAPTAPADVYPTP